MTAVTLRDVFLDYPVFGSYERSLKRSLLRPFTGDAASVPMIRALDGLTFSVSRGERLGLQGPNGSGKSTLLRLIAGVYQPSRGAVVVEGQAMPLLGLNAGVNLDLSAADNISLLLRIGGREGGPRAVKDVWDFTELDDRMRSMPLRIFSSGMLMRVLFAAATAFPADILLLDEWLSVVDETFTAKAEKRLQALVDEAAIVILASHDHDLLLRTCTRIITLDHGRIAGDFPTSAMQINPLDGAPRQDDQNSRR